jgi:hypothetical protein
MTPYLVGNCTCLLSGDYVTVFRGESETIVYGSGSDWYAQYSKVTNHLLGWRRWFSDRSMAENFAIELASKEYSGRFEQK